MRSVCADDNCVALTGLGPSLTANPGLRSGTPAFTTLRRGRRSTLGYHLSGFQPLESAAEILDEPLREI
jgi:hypothetical protein